MGRSIVAVVVGFLLIGGLSVGADALMHQLVPGAYNPVGRITGVPMLLFSQLYVAIFAVFGCYLCARLAPHSPMRHALILGALGLAFNIAGSYTQWADVPVWYHVVALTLTMPYAYIGGRLRERELASQSDAVPAAA